MTDFLTDPMLWHGLTVIGYSFPIIATVLLIKGYMETRKR